MPRRRSAWKRPCRSLRLSHASSPLVHAAAEAWANRLRAARDNDPERIDLAWRQAFGRSPEDMERFEAAQFLQSYRDELAASSAPNADVSALAAYLRTLIASNEFLHID